MILGAPQPYFGPDSTIYSIGWLEGGCWAVNNRLTVNDERLVDRVNAIVIEKFIDVRGAQLLAFGDKKEAVGGVDPFGKDHPWCEFGQKDLFFFARHRGFGNGADESTNGFGVERSAGGHTNGLNGVFLFQAAFGERDSDGEEAREPRDFVA